MVGQTEEQVKADEDYKRCLAAYNDFSATLAEKQAHITENETDIETYRKNIGDHKVQLQALLRDVEKIRSESHDAVADVITAKQEKDIADMLSGIAQDGTAEELQRMRQMRQELKAEARVSKELAGTDTKAQEAEFLEYARTSQSNTGAGVRSRSQPPMSPPRIEGMLPHIAHRPSPGSSCRKPHSAASDPGDKDTVLVALATRPPEKDEQRERDE